MSVNIFDEAKERVMPGWAKFVNPGDSTQGTYVGKIVGQKDGYGNEQVIYQVLQEDDSIINVGFGLNKKFLIQDMEQVSFGQIIGFKYKGKISVKDKFGKPVEVKDFALYQDPKIVNEKWLKENQGNMPKVVRVTEDSSPAVLDNELENFGKEESEDVPFSSTGSITNEDKLKVITKLAKDKLGASEKDTKEKVMEATSTAFIPVNFDTIIEKLSAM